MSIPKEPRQQMINIMYLVLIALLALSVSSEILNAFKLVNSGIDNSNKAIQEQIQAILNGFEEKLKKEPSPEGEQYFSAAQKAGTITQEFVKAVDELEDALKQATGVNEEGELAKPEDQDNPTRLLISERRAYDLETEIKATRQKFMDLFKPFKGSKEDIEYLGEVLPLNAPEPPEGSDKPDWVSYNFFQVPATAALTLLNQFRNDAINSESLVVQRLSEKAGGVDKKITFDEMKAVAIPSAKKVAEGEPFTVDVFLAATSAKERPAINVGGQTLKLDPSGVGRYSTTASGIGSKTLQGSMNVKDKSGKPKTIPFKVDYEVVKKPDEPLNIDVDKLMKELERLRKENALQKEEIKRQQEEIRRLKEEIERLKKLIPKDAKPKEEPKPKKDETPDLRRQIQELIRENENLKKQKTVKIESDIEEKMQGTVSPSKMNVFYIGVDNPIDIAVSGTSIDAVDAAISKGRLSGAGRGKYIAQVDGPHGSETYVTLSSKGEVIERSRFRVKRVPDPVPALSGKSGGVMGTGEIRAQRGLMAVLKDFDFDAKFDVLGFELTHAQRGEDLIIVTNKGPRFNEKAKKMLNKAEIGSIYYFDNIKVKGPDKATRKLPSISFKIK